MLTLGQLQSGQTVLIQAAAGGLGTIMVQIARNLGATAIGTCGSEEKCTLLREIGCPHPINYATTDFQKAVQQITGGRNCDLVIESVGGAVFDKSLRCVKTRGRLIVLGVASGRPRRVSVLDLFPNNLTVSGFHLMGYANDFVAMAGAVRDLHQWLDAGKLTIVVKHVFPLERAAEAQQLIAQRKTSGKVVLTTSG